MSLNNDRTVWRAARIAIGRPDPATDTLMHAWANGHPLASPS